MIKRSLFLSILLVVLMVSGTALAQGPAPGDSSPNWRAAYWNNMGLSGNPVFERDEPNLDYNWDLGSPDDRIHDDGFSARWSRYLDLSGTYRFTATSDDGIRVFLDGSLIINEWYDHPPQTVRVDRNLSAGHHLVVVEFYENMGSALAQFSWAPVTAINNWRGEYHRNRSLSDPNPLVRDDAQVNFQWGTGSPAQGFPADGFSVRWTRNLDLAAGSYRFSITVDDGARLWVNNHLLIDTWKDQPPTTHSGVIFLPGGSVPVKMEYYENTGGATARLSWARADGSGAVIVDDNGPGFTKGGASTSWRSEPEGYGGHLFWTKNNDRVRPNYNWARWYPKLTARRYEVQVYIPDRFTTTAQARYWVSHAGGLTLRVVNQSANGGRWVSLGTYQFRGNSNDYVSLADVTFEPYLSRLIAFDAVQWIPR